MTALAMLAVHAGLSEFVGIGGKDHRVVSDFHTVTSLQPRAPVQVAGVEVGRVEHLRLVKGVLIAARSTDTPARRPRRTALLPGVWVDTLALAAFAIGLLALARSLHHGRDRVL